MKLIKEMDFDTMLDYYRRLKFIYPEKEEIIFSEREFIANTWEKITVSGDELFHVIQNDNDKYIASGCLLRDTFSGWIVEHGVANDIKAYISMLKEECEILLNMHSFRTMRSWFQPTRRTVLKISMLNNSCEELRTTASFFIFKKNGSQFNIKCNYEVLDDNNQQELINVLNNSGRKLIVLSEDWDQKPSCNLHVEQLFAHKGLKKTKKTFLLREGKELLGLLIINIASPGMNLTLLENRSELIPLNDRGLLSSELIETALSLVSAHSFETLTSIPLLIPPSTKDIAKKFNNLHYYTDYLSVLWPRETVHMWLTNLKTKYNFV